MFNYSHNSVAVLLAVLQNMHKCLVLKTLLDLARNHTYVPRNSPLTKPIRLRLSVLLWEEFHGPILSYVNRPFIKGIQNGCSCLVLSATSKLMCFPPFDAVYRFSARIRQIVQFLWTHFAVHKTIFDFF